LEPANFVTLPAAILMRDLDLVIVLFHIGLKSTMHVVKLFKMFLLVCFL